jgi:hypothetical protein
MANGISFEEDGRRGDASPSLIELPALTEPGVLSALSDVATATALDLLAAFRAQGVDLGNPRNAEIVQATIRVVDDHIAGSLHALGALDDKAYGRLMQALAGLSLAIGDATYAVTGTAPAAG